MLIALNGYAGAGKDEVGKCLVEDHGFTRISFGDKVRDFALKADPLVGYGGVDIRLSEFVDALGWDEAKKIPEIRRILQKIGTEAAQTVFWPSIWADALFRDYDLGHFEDNNCVLTDFRFPHEAPIIQSHGAYTVLVDRPNVGPTNQHKSETALRDIKWVFDHTVDNSGSIIDLRFAVRDLYLNILSEENAV